MLKKIREFLVPGLILCSSGLAAAWTISAFTAPMPVFTADAVVIVSTAPRS